MSKATDICMRELKGKLAGCPDAEKSKFICPVQFICVQSKCLTCIQPQCVSKDDKELAKKLISEQTKMEQEETEQKYCDTFSLVKQFC